MPRFNFSEIQSVLDDITAAEERRREQLEFVAARDDEEVAGALEVYIRRAIEYIMPRLGEGEAITAHHMAEAMAALR